MTVDEFKARVDGANVAAASKAAQRAEQREDSEGFVELTEVAKG
jgi:hypothetical protein